MKKCSLVPFCPNKKHLANIYPPLKTPPKVYPLPLLVPSPDPPHLLSGYLKHLMELHFFFLVCPIRLWGHWGQGHILWSFAIPANACESTISAFLGGMIERTNEWMMDSIHGTMDLAFPTATMQSLSDKKCLSASARVYPLSHFKPLFRFKKLWISHRHEKIACSLSRVMKRKKLDSRLKRELSFPRSRAPTFLGVTERSTWENVGKGE